MTRNPTPANPKERNDYFKFISLEGIASVFLNSQPGETVAIHPGEMLIVPANATRLPKPVTIDLKKLVETSLLFTDFEPLASEPLIAEEIRKQQGEGVEEEVTVDNDPTSGDVIDQAFSAFPPVPLPPGPTGTTITYLGLPGGIWSSPASWTPAIVPNNSGGKAYTAIINSGMLTQDIVAGVIIQQLQMNGGTLVLTNPLTLNTGLQFTGGTFIGGNLFIAGTSTQATTMTLQNVMLNNSGAYNITINSGFAFNGAGSNFINSGTLRKADGGMEEVFFDIPITNTGTVSVPTGAFTFSGGGTNSGTFSAAAGGFLRIDGNFTFDATSNVTGAGTINFLSGTTNIAGGYNVTGQTNFSGATVNFNSPITSLGAVMIDSGAVNFNSTDVTASSITFLGGTMGGTAPNVNSTGLFTWTSGTFSGAGAINGNGGILLNNAQVFLNQRTLNNALGQTATMSNFSQILFQNGAVINNNGLFLVQTNTAADGFFYNSGADGTFNNNGTFTRNTGATSFVVTPQVAFNNAGTVNANSGTLVFNGGYTQTAGTTQLGGGDISSTSALQIQGGLLTGSGNIFASINSSATIRPSLGGSGLVVNGNVALMTGSDLSFQIGGLTQGSQYSFLNVSGMVGLDGNLVLSFANGFQNSVAPGDAFTIATATGGVTGIFANVASGARLDTTDGFGSFQVDYTGNNIVLSNFMPPAVVITEATWTGGAGNWSTPPNWDIDPNFPNNGQPNPGDLYNATLNNGGTITLDIPITIQNFTLGAGTVTGANSLTINQVFTWNGGTLAGGGVFNANGGISMAGGSQLNLNAATLNNAAGQTATDSGFHDFGLQSGGIINNAGIWLAQNDLGVDFGSGGTFNNSGTFTRNVGAGTYQVAFPFNNTGTVNVDTGTLGLNGGGTSTGGFVANVGAILSFNGGTHNLNGAMVSGAGTVQLGNSTWNLNAGSSYNVTGATTVSGSANFNVNANTNLLNVTAGSLGTGATFTISGLFNWAGGTLTGGGIFDANGGINMAGGSQLNLAGATLNNAAGQTATDSGFHDFGLQSGGIINNAGIWLAQNNLGIDFGSGGTFNNSGTFTRNVGAGTYQMAFPFDNMGSVNVQTGTLAFPSTTTSSGPISVSGGATLSLGGTFTQTAGAITLSSGNLAIGGNSMANLITGTSGMINVTAAGSLTAANGFDFRGVNNLGTPGGTLTLTAPSVTFGAAAINGALFTGGDAAGGSGVAGGNGGSFTGTATTGDILVGTNIDASSGGNDAVPNGGNGGTVSLTANLGTVTVNNRIQVSDTVAGRQSAAGGNINLSSGKNSGVAINVANSAQLLALLDGAAPGPGGLIAINATSVTGNSQVNVAGAIRADRGGIDIRNANAGGQITLTNAIMMADVIKVATLGDNSTLNINGGLISATTLLRLYAGSISGSNNSTINFTGTVNLTGAQIDIAANTVTIGVGSTVMTSSQAHVYATVRNYDLGSGGNGTGGMFGGAGAISFPLLMAPPLGPPGGTGAGTRPTALPNHRSHIRALERTIDKQNSQQNRQLRP